MEGSGGEREDEGREERWEGERMRSNEERGGNEGREEGWEGTV